MSPHQVRQAAGLAFRNRQRLARHLGRGVAAPSPAAAPRSMQSSLCRVAPAPSVEERLCAAAHRILSDGLQHAPSAQAWAVRRLARSAPSRDLTTFIRTAARSVPVSARELQQLQPRAAASGRSTN